MSSERIHDLRGLVDRERRLGEIGDAARVRDLDALGPANALDQHDRLGSLAGRALDLLVPVVADEEDRVSVLREAPRFRVHLAHERAGGVDHREVAPACRLADGRGDAVRREDGRGSFGDVVELVDEHRATALEVGDDVLVVDDLLPDVHGRAALLERSLDDLDRTLDPRAERPRRREENAARPDRLEPTFEDRRRAPEGEERPRARDRSPRVEELLPGVLCDGPEDRERPSGTRVREPGRLHVDGRGPGLAHERALTGTRDVLDRCHRADAHLEAETAERGREQWVARHLRHRAVGSTELGREDDLARRGAWSCGGAEPDHGHAACVLDPEPAGRRDPRPPRAHSGPDHP
jgi:hypothetical protein